MQEQTNNVITIVLTADNHLGYTVPGQPPRKREEQRQRQRRAFQQATDFAVGQGVDLFLQAGDLFDTPHPDEQDRSFVAARLAQLKQAGISVFALGGVHDTPVEAHSMPGETRTYTAPAPQLSFASLGALHYFPPVPGTARLDPAGGDSQPVLQPVMLDIRGILVGICGLGVPPLSAQQGDPLALATVDTELERAAIPLLLLHAPIEGVTNLTAALDTQAQVSRASITAQTAFRYILSGYHHAFTRFSLDRTEVIIAGATQHITFNDPDGDPGFVFLGIAADGLRWCRHISVDGVQLRRLVIPTADLWPDDTDEEAQSTAPAQSPTARILEQLRPLCTEDAMVQVRLTGELTRQRYHQIDQHQLRRYGEDHAFALAIDDSAVTFVPDRVRAGLAPDLAAAASDIEERLSPRDELIRLADEWIAAAEDEQEQQALVATKEELLAALWKL
jgi:DNA repair protein SbcD/Mre11